MRKIGWRIGVMRKPVKAFREKLNGNKTKYLLKTLFMTFIINCAGRTLHIINYMH